MKWFLMLSVLVGASVLVGCSKEPSGPPPGSVEDNTGNMMDMYKKTGAMDESKQKADAAAAEKGEAGK